MNRKELIKQCHVAYKESLKADEEFSAALMAQYGTESKAVEARYSMGKADYNARTKAAYIEFIEACARRRKAQRKLVLSN